MKKNLGPVVKAARDALRLTQRELAAIVNVKASHIAYIENNHRPSMSLLRRPVEALGLDRREVLFLVHPDAKYLTDDSTTPGNAKAGDAWKQFVANHAMLRRHNVSPAELRVLKQAGSWQSTSDSIAGFTARVRFASAVLSQNLNPDVLMMQPARIDASDCLRPPKVRSVFIQRKMGPDFVVIRSVGLQDIAQVRFAEHHQVVERFATSIR